MAGRTRVEWPGIDVVLKKTVRDQSGKSSRFRGGQSEFSLRPLLTDTSSVTVSRQINAPAGSFQVSVSDRGVRHGEAMDSLYGIAEPMDVLEIRMAQRPHEYAGKLPLVFRGVISEVRRDESMGVDGRPQRSVVLAGQDWGKFLQVIQDRYVKGNPLGLDWLSGLPRQSHWGIDYQVLPSADVIQQITEKVANAWLARLGASDVLVPFRVDVTGADPADKVMPQGFNAFPGGSLWDFMQVFGDLGPFYELFLDDAEAGPTLVYRKPPFVTADGDAVYGTLPDAVNVEPRQISRLSVARSDADVANWYWIEHSRLTMMSAQELRMAEFGSNPLGGRLDQSANSDFTLYGIRSMEVASHHGHMYQGAGQAQVEADKANFAAYAAQKLHRLKLANKDNVVFETGSMTIEGNERVKVGSHVRVQRGKSANLYYAQRVTHSFAPFRSFTTSVNFIRGTGFINRSSNDQLGVAAPYLEEVGRGPYEP